ncbi:OmpA family protein [Herbaspirillum sp. GCM10030257]|uniref:OmpA family protein n=1 Tax=Herbaspirillum sp. GCM10030257 TaxID=3273393 RepID=UPI00361A9348
MRKNTAFAILLSACAGSVSAQAFSDIQAKQGNSAYLQDSRGVIVRNPFGLCWRTGTWTPADAVSGCDGDLIPPVANPIAPPIAGTAPAAPAAIPAPKPCDFSVTLGSDESFAFNKSVLSSAAKKRIDGEVMSKLANCTKVDMIIVSGHADRLGSQQYNQKLSEKRADAVAAYLKSKGIRAEVKTSGAGKTQPLKACDEKLTRKQLIDCLAPNRRVVIEARGFAQ